MIDVAREKLRKRRLGASLTAAVVRPFPLLIVVSEFILSADSET